jgi:hypothetical protein
MRPGAHMARFTTRKRGRNGGDDRSKKPASGFAVFEAEYPSNEPRGDALASFATRAEADAFVKGLNFHDPKTIYVIHPAR